MRRTRNLLTLLSIAMAGTVSACSTLQVETDNTASRSASDSGTKVILTSEVKWEKLNPARGDKSPMAATLWGDRNGKGPTGFLFKAVDGFKSPPHIHNVSYRGIVIDGLIHNDDPGAANMWLPKGSFWTQPKGEGHLTAVKGSNTLAYIEIEEGPYLVLPTDKAFDSGERPVNVDASNIVWVDQPGSPASLNGPKVAYLWGSPQDGQLNGTLIKLPAGYSGKIRNHGSTFTAVVIQGNPKYQMPGKNNVETLEPGSYFSSKGESVHRLSSNAKEESILYMRMEGKFDVIPVQLIQKPK
ncbi:MAG: DUF4437 domain-containing protein [Candidatus Nitronauta litoralis]|uniref:DUF4437 domain-containing protein n=1 Tax=Candidatus Nitronauta litoralis TaxID=2705533 RepID=A0A7T0BZU6_9BACT|nr:MAG: DUF4437 domain-containing protein [Candidatus Nitronauta litoralis]